MNDRAPAPGGLALIQSLVNTLDIESGADSLDTAEGRATFGLARASRRRRPASCASRCARPAWRTRATRRTAR